MPAFKKNLKILVVDDELLIRRAIELAGKSRGHKVRSVGGAMEALSLWPSFDPDLAFIDILLPQMSGWDLLKKIPEGSKAKTIMISAHDEMSAKDIKNKGADLFIPKPFADIFQLIEKAEQLCQSEK